MFDKYDYILFDLDNTLLDFSQISKKALYDTFASHEIENKQENHETYHQINGLYWHYFEKQQINAFELRIGRFERFFNEINVQRNAEEVSEAYINNLIKHSEWIEGAQALLENLYADKELVLITNGLQSAQRGRIKKHGLTTYFKHIFISEEMGVSKPHKEFYAQVHQALNLPNKESVLVVGDNPISDIKGGKQFGYRTCWYNYAQQKKAPIQADYKVNSWGDYA